MDLQAIIAQQNDEEERERLAEQQRQALEAYRNRSKDGGVPANKSPI